MSHWTIALDESGRFEGVLDKDRVPEVHPLVVGGPLIPCEAEVLDRLWRDPLIAECCRLGVSFPPRLFDVKEPSKKEALQQHCSQGLASTKGMWVFVVAPPPSERDDLLGVYVRMLGDVMDLACRLVSTRGGTHLYVRIAQRTVPLTEEGLRRADQLGVGHVSFDDKDVLALAKEEVRQVVDGVRREEAGLVSAWPRLADVDSWSAHNRDCPAAISYADVGCNSVYRALRGGHAEVPGLEHAEGPVFIVGRDSLALLRRMDRRLREIPPDLVGAMRAVDGLRGTAKAEVRHRLAATSSVFAASTFFDWHLGRIDKSLTGSRQYKGDEHAIATVLAAHANAHLALKGGDYEGTWAALEHGWSGAGSLAARIRGAIDDRELIGQLWRLTTECANHRGDHVSADAAVHRFDELAATGASLALAAEQLIVQNLSVVSVQNRFLPEPADLSSLRAELEQRTDRLEAVTDAAGAVAPISRPATLDELEPTLWERAEISERWVPPDRERGRCYGTVGRSRAFLGDPARATSALLRARSFFGGSGLDLAFNAAVIARVALDRARVLGAKGSVALAEIALRLANAHELTNPTVAAAAVAVSPAARFGLDLVLRTLLWCPAALPNVIAGPWVKALVNLSETSLYSTLSRGEHRTSHPTDLVARHAAELLVEHREREKAKRWFELARAVAEGKPPTSTAARVWRFTEHLARGGKPEGDAGSVLNPAFEYR